MSVRSVVITMREGPRLFTYLDCCFGKTIPSIIWASLSKISASPHSNHHWTHKMKWMMFCSMWIWASIVCYTPKTMLHLNYSPSGYLCKSSSLIVTNEITEFWKWMRGAIICVLLLSIVQLKLHDELLLCPMLQCRPPLRHVFDQNRLISLPVSSLFPLFYGQ